MKKIVTLILLSIVLFTSCNSYKKAQKNIYSGNFDQALDGLIKKYKNDNISAKDVSRWASLFNDAYVKAKSQNKEAIYSAQFMVESTEKHRLILHNYQQMQVRIDKLKPYMPLKVDGQDLVIDISSYYIEIENSKLQLANALFLEAEQLMAYRDKMSARMAYDKYAEIAQLQTSYTAIQSKIDLAYRHGLSYTLVSVNNDSRSFLPRRLQDDITNFNAYGINSFWNVMHIAPQNVNYDYYLELNFRDIVVRPDRVDRKEFTVSKELESKDTSRNAPKRTISCKVIETRLFKDASINSEIVLLDHNKQIVHRESPLVSTFIFDYKWAEYHGNKEALDEKYKRSMKNCSVAIPSHEAMLFDCAQDLKEKFKSFIHQNVVNI